MPVPSRDQVESALSYCSGDEEETVGCLVRSVFLNNVYAGCDRPSDGRPCQLKSLQLNEELTTLLKDESLPRDVSRCITQCSTYRLQLYLEKMNNCIVFFTFLPFPSGWTMTER